MRLLFSRCFYNIRSSSKVLCPNHLVPFFSYRRIEINEARERALALPLMNTCLNKEQDMTPSFGNDSNTSKQLTYHDSESRQVRTGKRRVLEPVTFKWHHEHAGRASNDCSRSLSQFFVQSRPTSKGHTGLISERTAIV